MAASLSQQQASKKGLTAGASRTEQAPDCGGTQGLLGRCERGSFVEPDSAATQPNAAPPAGSRDISGSTSIGIPTLPQTQMSHLPGGFVDPAAHGPTRPTLQPTGGASFPGSTVSGTGTICAGSHEGWASIESLPDTLLALIFRAAYSKATSFSYATVSRRWRDLAHAEQQTVRVLPRTFMLEADLASELSRLPNLTSLHVEKQSAWHLSDSFLHTVGQACPRLKEFTVDPAAGRRPSSPSSEALFVLLDSLPALKSLSLPLADREWGPSRWDPQGATRGLTSLELKELFGTGWGRLEAGLGPMRHVFSCLGSFPALRHLGLEIRQGDLPDSVGGLHRLTSLTFVGLHSKHLPSSIGRLHELAVLDLTCSAASLPDTWRHLTRLRRLRMEGWQGQSLPGWVGVLRCLTDLRVFSTSLTDLPPSVWSLTQLRTLELWCWLLELPEEVGRLRNLRNVRMHRTRAPARCSTALSSLSALTHVNMDYNQVDALLPALPRMSALKSMRLNLDGYSRDPFPALSCLSNLERLEATGSFGLAQLTHCLPQMGSLKALKLNTSRPQDLNCCLPAMAALQHVSLKSRQWDTTSQPDANPLELGFLTSVRSLEVVWPPMESLDEGFGRLRWLRTLTMERCATCHLPNSFCSLSSLQELVLADCHRLKSLPPSFGDLGSLTHMQLMRVPLLAKLPSSIRQLPCLRTLEIVDCRFAMHGLDSLPQCLHVLLLRNAMRRLPEMSPTFGDLAQLRILEIADAAGPVRLPDSLGGLKQLRLLRLKSIKGLTWLPVSLAGLKMLREVEIEHCPSLMVLPAALLDLPSLSNCTKTCLTMIANVHTSVQIEESIEWEEPGDDHSTKALEDSDDE